MALIPIREEFTERCQSHTFSEITGIKRFRELDQKILDSIFESPPTYRPFMTMHYTHLPSVVVTQERGHFRNSDYDEEKLFWIFGPAKRGPKSYVFGFFLISRHEKTGIHDMLSSELFVPSVTQNAKWFNEVIFPYEEEEERWRLAPSSVE